MGFFGVIPDEVVHKFSIEGIRLVKGIEVPISKLLLYSAVKALQVSIRLGMAWVVEVVCQVLLVASFLKVFEEFVAVISLYSGYFEWGNKSQLLKEIPGTG